jgi:hypothetical protein
LDESSTERLTDVDHRLPSEQTELTDDVRIFDQLILSSKTAPVPTVVDNVDRTSRTTVNPFYQRSLSHSSHFTDDDDDDKSESLHVLSDEQLQHLTSTRSYHSSASVGTQQEKSPIVLPSSLLYSLSNPLAKLVLNE